MRARSGWFALALVVCMAISGCVKAQSAPPSASATAGGGVSAFKTQVDGLQQILSGAFVKVEPEPRGNTWDDGTRMAVIHVASAGPATPTVTVDFISEGSAPGTESHGWNRFKHPQTFRVRRDAALAVSSDSTEFEIVTPAVLAAEARSNPETVYYVTLWQDEVYAVWPVPFP